MRRIARLLVGFALPLVTLLGCGDEGPPPEPTADIIDRLYVSGEKEEKELIAELSRRSKADPQVIEMLIARMRVERPFPLLNTVDFTVDFEAAKIADIDRVTTLRAASAVMSRRLQAYGYAAAHFDLHEKEGTIRMGIPLRDLGAVPEEERAAEEERYLEGLIANLTDPGTAELLLEVVPPAEGLTPASLWNGTAAAFKAFLRAEQRRLDEALAQRTRYEPTRSDFQLALVRPQAAGEQPGRVLLFRAPERAQHFASPDFEMRTAVDTDTDQFVLELVFPKERAAQLEAWSRHHVGRRMALVINGRAEILLDLVAPLGQRVIVPLGPKTDRRTGDWMAGMLAAVRSGQLPTPVSGKVLRDVPPDQVTPAMRALAGIGMPAAEALVKMRAEGGNIGARALRALELIGRSAVK